MIAGEAISFREAWGVIKKAYPSESVHEVIRANDHAPYHASVGAEFDKTVAAKYKRLETLNLSGNHVALFGGGDQLIYSDTFQDAIGILATEFLKADATIVGHWPIDGYDFSASKGVVGNQFIGLALDDDNQANLTAQRIKTWVAQVLKEMNVQTTLAVT